MKVKGQAVLVTGANRGLGRAVAEAFLAAGAKVYAGSRDASKVAIAGAIPLALDVTDPASVAAAAVQAGDVSIVINNAGIFSTGPAVGEDALARLRSQFETNVVGTWNVSHAFAPILGKNGGGAIVDILSVLSWLTLEGTSAYSASKAAAWALTNGLRKELAGQGTQVIGLHVGYMDTDMTAGLDAPKSAPADVAAQILAAIEDGRSEILADGISQNVKASFGTPASAYL